MDAGRLTARTAIVHDWFQGFHGAERVVETMRSGLFADGNEPDVFTFHAARELLPAGLANAIVQESRIGRLPGVRQRGHDPGRWRFLLAYMPTYFRSLKLEQYDLVIASSHACAVHARPRDDAVHVCYCYTPMRYAWTPRTDFDRVRGVKGAALRAIADRLRRLDLEASQRPHAYLAISSAVRDRIRRFYGRDAVVVHPPVDVTEMNPRAEKDPQRFLWVHRLVAYKRPEIVVEAFRRLPFRLTMVGVGPLEERLRSIKPPNVELLGWLPRADLVRLYERSAGFIHVGEEDFGISMVEALAAGTPVLALDRGGARDIVRHGREGLLIERADPAAVREGVIAVARREWDRRTLAARAREFRREAFLERFTAAVDEARARAAPAGRAGRR
jgi:glycosyltransferase involved in cell wall biosynthesis